VTTVTEKDASKINGYLGILLVLILLGLEALLIKHTVNSDNPAWLAVIIPVFLLIALMLNGFIVVNPNDSRVLIFLGKYIGTVRESGFWFVNFITVKKRVTLRMRNFISEKVKVNDLLGNPIEIAAVVVWKVTDSARAVFDVDNYEEFVAFQSETAIRGLASEYPYDGDDDSASLRKNPHEIGDALKKQVQSRLDIAGVEVIEARISHLAYAQEIAQAMLRKQQAHAIVAARQKIVEGAVGMVESALKALSEQNIVNLDEDKKATMVNNLMVALVSDHEARPVINTGTLYQ
jgi:regulator of protease activity HflC (stomatin/prohibitin superfamily)